METKKDQGRMQMRRSDGEEEMFSQGEDEEPGEDTEREEKKEEAEEEKKVVASERDVMATEGEEEEQVKPESGLEVEEVQMESNTEGNKNESIADKQDDTQSFEEKDEQKKNRKRRVKKQTERVRNKRGFKDVSDRFEEEKKSQTQQVSGMSSEESSALSEPHIGLMNSCDLSDPIYLGCGGTGLCCPPVPIPLLYSSQPPGPLQPAPPQPRGTKRPHSPVLPHSVTQQGPQPLEVRIDSVTVYHSLAHLITQLLISHCSASYS